MSNLQINYIRNELKEKLLDKYEIELFSHLKTDKAEEYLAVLTKELPEFEFRIYDSYGGCIIVAMDK